MAARWWYASDEPDRYREGDSRCFKWHLERDGESSFVVVSIPGSVSAGSTTTRPETLEALETDGRSQVEQYRDRDTLPRRINLSRGNPPTVVEREGD